MEQKIKINEEDVKRLKSIYKGMKHRCYDKRSYGYKWYGAKGIGVCEIWKKDFWHFYYWAITHGYNNTLTLDRLDNNKDYSPFNCRWVSVLEQHKNMSSTKLYTYKEKTQTLREWCDEYNIDIELVRNRLSYGWSFDRALQKTKRATTRGQYIVNGKINTLTRWCQIYGTSYKLVYNRLQQGWGLEKALTTPKKR